VKLGTRLGARDRRALALGALVLVPALGFALVVKPYLHARAMVEDRVRVQKELLRRELALVAAAHDLPARLEGATRAFASARSHLLSGRDPLGATAGLVSLVGDEARRRGVLLEAIESDASEPLGDGLVAVQIEVRGRGDLEGLLRWLNALETGPRLLRVERLAVGRLDQGIARDSLDVETLTLGAEIRGYVFVGSDGAMPPRAVASAESPP
jgi:type II secretory pathway component PulM